MKYPEVQIVKTYTKIEVALNLACQELAETLGDCPVDHYDMNEMPFNCPRDCKEGREALCWKEYLLEKAEY